MNIDELSGWGISQAIAQVVEDGFVFNEETGEVFFTADDLDKLNEAFDKKIISTLCASDFDINAAKTYKPTRTAIGF